MPAQPGPSEIINLLLIVVLVPLTVMTVRRYQQPGYRGSMIGFACVALAILLAVIEHPLQSRIVSDVKNVLYACGGIGFAVGIWQLNMAMRRGEVW